MGKMFDAPLTGMVSCATSQRRRRSPIVLGRRLLADCRAAAAIEFALSLPFMLLLLVGAFDYGNLAYTMMEVNQAAHAGAFYAYSTYQGGGTCVATATPPSPSITTSETSATNLTGITTSTKATGKSALAQAAPSCSVSACYGSSGLTITTSGNCSGGDKPGTYAVAYAQVTFKPLLPYTALAFPSTLSSVAVIRYQ